MLFISNWWGDFLHAPLGTQILVISGVTLCFALQMLAAKYIQGKRKLLGRMMPGIAVAMIVGGWGMMRYADRYEHDEQCMDEGSSQGLYVSGIVMMAIGAGAIGLLLSAPIKDASEPT